MTGRRDDDRIEGRSGDLGRGAGEMLVQAVCLAELPADEGLLSPDERERARALVLPARRRDFVAGRAFLRRTLGERLGRDPAALRFVYGPLGKPGLADRALGFNLAHSGDRLLLAIVAEGEIGVDLELLQGERDFAALARRFFAPEERRQLEGLAGEGLRRTFLEIWTAKEAVLKALGSGVFAGLQAFAVSAGPEPSLLRAPREPAFHGLELRRLAVPGAVAALCGRGLPPDPARP